MKNLGYVLMLLFVGCASTPQKEISLPPAKPYKVDEARILFGAASAPITIVEYGDFQCPACAMGYTSIEEVKKKYGDKVRVIYKNVPLDFHSLAMPAAEIFEGLMEVDKAKAQAFYANAYGMKGQWGDEKALWAELKKLDVKEKELKAVLKKGNVKKRIAEDLDEHRRLGFRGTPAFLINGIPLEGAHPPENFAYIIDQQLKAR